METQEPQDLVTYIIPSATPLDPVDSASAPDVIRRKGPVSYFKSVNFTLVSKTSVSGRINTNHPACPTVLPADILAQYVTGGSGFTINFQLCISPIVGASSNPLYLVCTNRLVTLVDGSGVVKYQNAVAMGFGYADEYSLVNDSTHVNLYSFSLQVLMSDYTSDPDKQTFYFENLRTVPPYPPGPHDPELPWLDKVVVKTDRGTVVPVAVAG